MPELGTTPIEKTLVDAAYVPLQIQKQVKDNLGGHWNHTFFWQLMTPGGAKEPGGELKSAIETEYGDVDKLKERFNEAGAARFGSGWAWLDRQQEQEARDHHDGQPGHADRGRRRARCSASMSGSTPIT